MSKERPASKTTGSRYSRRNAVLAEMGYSSYRAYLASDLWKSIRERVLERDGGMCRMCLKRKARSVHHITYHEDTLRGETLDQLVSVCGGCHVVSEFDRKGEKLTYTADIGRRAHSRFKRKADKKAFRPTCVICGQKVKKIGRDDICMVCYRSGRALKWREEQAAKQEALT
jgi:5-methylcytosine-specific restriction endonuclease McrA